MAIFTTFGKQKDDKSTLFPGGVSVKFWNDLLGLAKGKRNSTPTHNCISYTVFRNCVIHFVGFLEWRSGVLKWSGVNFV